MTDMPSLSCPVPHGLPDTVQLAHGGGGRAMQRLITGMFRAAFDNPWLGQEHDGAVLDLTGRCAVSTDSYVVRPLIFPGGDIGTLAVNGTVNDLAMCGALPRFLTAGFVLEEGLDMAVLSRIAASMAAAAAAAGVQIVAGDVKVVDRGGADGMYVNTSGIGEVACPTAVAPASVRAGDAILLSGDIGRHGIAVMAARGDLEIESGIESDCAPLIGPVMALLDAGIRPHCLRDLTRGGLASALVEIAESAGLSIRIRENGIPVREDVQAACELLGLDPIYVANEGRFIAFLDAADVDKACEVLRKLPVSAQASIIGEVERTPGGRVSMLGTLGAARVIDMLSGEQLPRIC